MAGDSWWNLFRRLPEEDREELFALSCLSYNQIWIESQLQTEEKQSILRRGQDLMDGLLDRGLRERRRDSEYETDEQYLKRVLFEGDELTVPFVSQHLTDNINQVSCETESRGSDSEPDIIVEKQSVTVAKLEIKRTVSSQGISGYVDGFVDKGWHARQPSIPSVLVMYFPLICDTPAWRAERLVRGYQELVKEHPGWVDGWMRVRTIPTPLSPKNFGALETTENIVRRL